MEFPYLVSKESQLSKFFDYFKNKKVRKQKKINKLENKNADQRFTRFEHVVYITLGIIALPIELLKSIGSPRSLAMYAAAKEQPDDTPDNDNSKNKSSFWGFINRHRKKFKEAGEKINENNDKILDIKATR